MNPPGGGRAVGIDVGGTKCLGVALGADGQVRAEAREATPRGGEAIVAVIASLVERLGGGEGDGAGGPVAVGVGAPGLVDRTGRLRAAPNLPGVEELPLGELLAARLGRPVVVDNDATCAMAAEHALGAAHGADTAVLVTLGTGIGGGLVTGGQLHHGAHGLAGEPGHMVVDPDGVPCPCGRRGCWERYASGSGLGRLGRQAAIARRLQRSVELAGGEAEAVRGEHVTAAAREGDAQAVLVVRRFAWWLALGVANLVNLLDPDVVVLGGGVVRDADLLLDPLLEQFGDLVLAADHRPAVAIRPAVLGERAGAIGAALLGRGTRPGWAPAGR